MYDQGGNQNYSKRHDKMKDACGHIHDAPIRQSDWDTAIFLLSRIVDAFNSSPDGPLGKGFTCGLFFDAHEFLNHIGYADDPEYKKNYSSIDFHEKVMKVRDAAEKYFAEKYPC